MATTHPDNTNHALLRLEEVDKTFRMGDVSVEALRDVSLQSAKANCW